jgi:hypothetical protein
MVHSYTQDQNFGTSRNVNFSSFGILSGHQLNFMAISVDYVCVHLLYFGTFYQEKSGNPEHNVRHVFFQSKDAKVVFYAIKRMSCKRARKKMSNPKMA